MTPNVNKFAVFVKPWKNLTLKELCMHIHAIGFRWVELPIRPGFPCQPDTIEQDLPKAVAIFADYDIKLLNISTTLPMDNERLYAACASAEVGMHRVMIRHDNLNYWEAEKQARIKLDSAILLCEKYNVQIGIQNHVGSFVAANALSLWNLIKDYPPQYIGAIWDAGHNALGDMEPEPALDVVESHLCVVNLKNAYWRIVSESETGIPLWRFYWTSGKQGLASWSRVAAKIKAMDYTGPICLTAEYSDIAATDQLISEDLSFAKMLFNKTHF